MRNLVLAMTAILASGAAGAQMNPSFSIDSNGSDIVTTAVFSDVTTFQIRIEFDEPIRTGVYDNPALVQVVYSVSGDLMMGTPSGFPSFALERTITGADFYAQGSSLRFEVAADAFIDDGVVASELVGTGGDVVFRFDGREVDNGRFHPALLELRADGTGRIQNSNNVPSQNPLQEVAFGEEYITDFTYIPAEFTILTEMDLDPIVPVPPQQGPFGGSGGGSVGIAGLLFLVTTLLIRRRHRRHNLAQP